MVGSPNTSALQNCGASSNWTVMVAVESSDGAPSGVLYTSEGQNLST